MDMLKKVLLLVLSILAVACADTKIYIGSENDQFILGIDSMLADVDGAGGLEIRTYLEKKGLLINGLEYGAKAGKTVYTLTGGGKTREGNFLKYQRRWSSLANDSLPLNTIQLGVGQGDNILQH
ncbi:hypothetical protein NO2_0464 [Candidatus Termititenax persephonae]|uniref:Uncharacterized protein n=1 Tax=Candidatus Termititenax persephonae TaxID=2218525 RepID=A0A388TFK6_9BACT|nr:hypothetical protein NO2_0464 [Candidatus Termititenax persephonae]